MSDLIVVTIFREGGWIMWPILLASIVALSIIVERFIWWFSEHRKREPAKVEQVMAALEKGEIKTAAEIAGTSTDALLRVLWFGLNNKTSLQGALQVAAGIELERAGRFIIVLDTIVTLAPLLGLLGTVTGLMKAFFKIGSAELSEQAIGGGIAEALIATACGLSIAVVSLVFLNYFAAKVSKFQFELQTVCGRAEVLLHFHVKDDSPERIHSSIPDAPDTSSLTPPSRVSPESMNPPTI